MSEHTLVRLPAIIFYTIPELIFCRDLLWEDLQVDSVEQGTRNKLKSSIRRLRLPQRVHVTMRYCHCRSPCAKRSRGQHGIQGWRYTLPT